jgi:hypothetical protein
MKRLLVYCLIICGISSFAQQQIGAVKVTKEEWDKLDKVFQATIDAISNNNEAAFNKIAYPVIDCIDCVGTPEFNNRGYFVTRDVFYLNIAGNFTKSPVYKALVKRGYTFGAILLKGYRPKYLPDNYPEDLTLYEVWIPTYLANELSKVHPGTSHAFQFVKINGEFKLFGMTSIP